MLTIEQAKKIGINWCAEQIGRVLVKKYADSSSMAFGEEDGQVFCFLGIDDNPLDVTLLHNIILSSKQEDAFPYSASCYVSTKDGTIQCINTTRPQC